jgi:hypothetical protein
MDGNFNIDRSKWQKAKYLGHYDERATNYEDIRTGCMKCENSFIFSAQTQKIAFETDKRYPGWLPTLCLTCTMAWGSLNQEILACDNLWAKNRASLITDQEFLLKWLALLNEARPYGKKRYDSRISMINKIIKSTT